ncbi:hypothetical protein V9T40_005353 [Parthenolecanium corni]|uniref:Small-subunit processome Utp12 domain-containing protein n=1 Tax=Parthenolecanium corni TaxID=536013 RepID=A0AAN9TIL1_9HEMI
MGLTKQYLRYESSGKFNIISSANCNVQYVKVDDKTSSRYIAAGTSEDVTIWDSRLAKKKLTIRGEKFEVVHICACAVTHQLAVGYRDGTVIVYDSKTGDSISTFAGHRSTISCISFDKAGHRLATGSKDTDIVLWDVVGEQGLCRLSGHKGPITRIEFMSTQNILISSSVDTFVKFWDLTSGHCFKTLVGHVTEVWSFCLMKNDSYLVTATNDSELRVWSLKESQKTDDNVDYEPVACEKIGSIVRQGLGRVVSMCADSLGQILCCHGNEKQVEVFYFHTTDEVAERYQKKLKKLKKKLGNASNDQIEALSPNSLQFCVSRLAAVKTGAKVKSADVWLDDTRIKIVAALNNNSLEFYGLTTKSKDYEFEKVITGAGHTSDVRSLAFGEDGVSIVSGSGTGIKVWNNISLSCIRTVDTTFVLTICFAPGDRYILAGTKAGALLIVDTPSGEVVESVEAHEKELWKVALLPNKLGCVTCSSDCTVKIWNFELVKNEHQMMVLSLLHVKTLQLQEPILDVRVTADSNLIAAALLDSTVQIFFMDSLKFFLNLHGHKLPVTCLDTSYDSSLIATGSADCCVKIWGLDYGDCHKSILAHKMAVSGLAFVPKTHYFFTCGKDGAVHQWDADNFERIQTLRGHFGEAWGLCVSLDGQFVISCGQDRVMRVYEKTFEPLVLEDEREAERQQEEEETLATGDASVLKGRAAMVLASKRTVNAERGAELLLECLDTVQQYKEELKQSKNTPLPPIMMAFNATTSGEYVMAILKKIRCSDMEEILSLLPFASVNRLIEYLIPLLRSSKGDVEILNRVLVFLLKAHHKPIVSSRNLFLAMKQLQSLSLDRVTEAKDLVGCNLHGLLYVQREREQLENGLTLFADALQKRKKRKVPFKML